MRMAALVMLSGCSLVATSATPHHATPGGPPTGCDSIIWPAGDFVLAPVATVLGGAIFVGESVESGTPAQYYIAPVLLIATGITALASGFTGMSRIGRCTNQLPRAKPDPVKPDSPKPAAPDRDDDSRPSWGQ